MRVVTRGVYTLLFSLSLQFSFSFFFYGAWFPKKQLDSCGILPEFLLLFEP